MKKLATLPLPIPSNEEQRLEVLQRYEVLDTMSESDFDELAALAAHICKTPIALVTLIDAHRLWCKSNVGIDTKETSRTSSFCQYTILSDKVYEVPNTLDSEHFSDNPYVTGEPNIRFYAGAPLITSDGFKLGSICVMDRVPRKLAPQQVKTLQILARQVVNQLELRRQERELKEHTVYLENYLTFFSISSEIMGIMNAQSLAFEEVNEAFCRITGYVKQEVIGKRWIQFISKDDLLDTLVVLKEGLHQGGEIREFDNRIICKDGSERWISWSAVLRKGQWFINGRDVTRRREIDKKLNDSNRLLVDSQSIAHVGSWEYDPDNQYVYWSEEMFRLCGLEPSPHPPSFQAFLEMLHPEDAAALANLVEIAIQKGVPYYDEARLLLPDGTIRYVIGQGQLKTEGARSRRVIGTIMDITERKLAEMELLKAKELAEKSKNARQQFLSNMSHEIRTPMNNVIGITQLLMQEEPKPSQLEYLNSLQFSSEKLLVLINDILDFGKIDAGKINFETIDFNLKDLIHSIGQSLAHKAEEKNLKLKIRLDSDLPEVLEGDPMRLNQVLTNLLSNAIKFTEQGFVEVSVTIKNETSTNVTIDFAVTDTGIGIPADKLTLIFDSFTQAHSDTTRKYGGSGLGLAISKRLIEFQNSQLLVESQEGKGSKFFFELSFCKGKKKLPDVLKGNNSSPDQNQLQDVRVLLVEDNEINRMVASKFLAKWGVKITNAENGKVALKKIESKQFDIVLMDLQMPEMDGYSATVAIRAMEDSYFQKIPIIALTASAMMDVKDRVFVTGMTDYLAKPFNPKDLFNKIAKHVKAFSVETAPNTQEKAVNINFEHFINSASNDLDFARHITEMCIEALNTFKVEYSTALLRRDLPKLKFIRHSVQAVLQSLELSEILTETENGERMLQNVDSSEANILESVSNMQALCMAAITQLKNKLNKLITEP
jgi:PAS domain S-box-containing protein